MARQGSDSVYTLYLISNEWNRYQIIAIIIALNNVVQKTTNTVSHRPNYRNHRSLPVTGERSVSIGANTYASDMNRAGKGGGYHVPGGCLMSKAAR